MSDTVQNIIILLPILLISMSIHEMLHAFASDWLGDDTARVLGRVSLNPLPHIDPIWTVAVPVLLLISGSGFIFGAAKPVPVNFHRLRYGEFGGAIVGAVGPISNLLIAGAAGLLFNIIDPIFGSTLYDIFRLTIILNLGLFLFNSIPWPPLDGSRVLYAFAPKPLQEFMESIERMGVISIAILVFILFQFGSPLGNLMVDIAHYIAPGLIL